MSGFVCEIFGYIPEEGGKTVVKLEKANNEEENGYQEKADNNHNPDDNHSNHEKHQTFEIEVSSCLPSFPLTQTHECTYAHCICLCCDIV